MAARGSVVAACAAFIFCGSALAQAAKPYATVGAWKIQKYPGYCLAKAGLAGDRAMRLRAPADGSSSFGFMGGGGTANGKKIKVVYKLNDNPTKFTRDAVARINQAEDGGAPWLVFSDPPHAPSHAGDWATAKTMSVDYVGGGQRLSETHDLRDVSKAWETLWACSGG